MQQQLDNLGDDINEQLQEKYVRKQHIADYITLLKFQKTDAESDRDGYKSKYLKYRKTFMISTIFMLLFALLCANLFCITPCLILVVGIYFTNNKKSLVWCHYILYIMLTLIVTLYFSIIFMHLEQ